MGGLRRPAAVLAMMVMAGPAVAAAPAGGALQTRTFTAHYRPVDEIVALIQPAITEQGSYSVQPRIKALTITDTAESLRRIQDLIAGFDLPPRSVSLLVQLMRAEEGPAGDPPARPGRRMGLPPAVIQDLTKWGVITQIGNAALRTAENENGSVQLGEEYRVRFSMGAVTPSLGIVRMERFVLEKSRRGEDGVMRFVPMLDLVLNLKDRQTTVVGATSSQDSKQALFVSVTASAGEP